MAVLPGSLDYLYYNGILERIPYEAYEMTPMTASGQAQMMGLGTGYGDPALLKQQAYANPMQRTSYLNKYKHVPNVSGNNGYDYLQQAQQGYLYNASGSYPDSFSKNMHPQLNKHGNYSIIQQAYNNEAGVGSEVDYGVMAYGQDAKDLGLSIKESASNAKDKISNSPSWFKGILSGGILITTLCLLVKRFKK